MRYWDASAVAPLLITEPPSARMRELLDEDHRIVTSAWTVVEITSAVERRVRDGALDRSQRRAVLERLGHLAETWDEVTDVLSVRRRAGQLLARHPLRAADAGQLAAALLVAPDDGAALPFVCQDQRLADAAEREGLRPIPDPGDV